MKVAFLPVIIGAALARVQCQVPEREGEKEGDDKEQTGEGGGRIEEYGEKEEQKRKKKTSPNTTTGRP